MSDSEHIPPSWCIHTSLLLQQRFCLIPVRRSSVYLGQAFEPLCRPQSKRFGRKTRCSNSSQDWGQTGWLQPEIITHYTRKLYLLIIWIIVFYLVGSEFPLLSALSWFPLSFFKSHIYLIYVIYFHMTGIYGFCVRSGWRFFFYLPPGASDFCVHSAGVITVNKWLRAEPLNYFACSRCVWLLLSDTRCWPRAVWWSCMSERIRVSSTQTPRLQRAGIHFFFSTSYLL